MTYPTAAVVTANLDAGTDSPASARTDLFDAVQKLNQMIAHTSAFAAALLDDASASAARATLGSGATGDALFAAATAAAARAMLGAAESGANSDITSLSGLTDGIVGASGNQTIGGTKTFSTQPVLPQAPVLGTAVATTSGTSIDFTGIPDWIKKITLMMDAVSTNGSSSKLIQIGDSGGIETTGYLGSAMSQTNPNAVSGNMYVGSGFEVLAVVGGADVCHGAITLTLMDASTNTWTCSGVIGLTNSARLINTAGTKSITAKLDRIRLTTANGTDSFDAGTFNILYE